jgi:hypothetical protein
MNKRIRNRKLPTQNFTVSLPFPYRFSLCRRSAALFCTFLPQIAPIPTVRVQVQVFLGAPLYHFFTLFRFPGAPCHALSPVSSARESGTPVSRPLFRPPSLPHDRNGLIPAIPDLPISNSGRYRSHSPSLKLSNNPWLQCSSGRPISKPTRAPRAPRNAAMRHTFPSMP